VIAHADVQKPVIQVCHQIRTAAPCYATIRTLLPNGHYRYHRIIVRATGTTIAGAVSLAP
jgi:hypothetical protein